MVTHACKPGTLEAEDRLLHSKTLDRHPRKRREKGQKRERSEGRREGGEKYTEEGNMCPSYISGKKPASRIYKKL